MKKKKIIKIFLLITFSLSMVLGITCDYDSLLNTKEQLISKKKNCKTVNGVEVCDDCDDYNDPITGTSGHPSPNNPPCETRERDCQNQDPNSHITYDSHGCHCVTCSTCAPTEPEPEEYYCYDY